MERRDPLTEVGTKNVPGSELISDGQILTKWL